MVRPLKATETDMPFLSLTFPPSITLDLSYIGFYRFLPTLSNKTHQ